MKHNSLNPLPLYSPIPFAESQPEIAQKLLHDWRDEVDARVPYQSETPNSNQFETKTGKRIDS